MEYFQLLYATRTSRLSKQKDITAHGLFSEVTVASISLMPPCFLLRPYQHARLTFHRSIPAKGELKKGGWAGILAGGREREEGEGEECCGMKANAIMKKKMAFSAFSDCSSHIKMTKTINSGQG